MVHAESRNNIVQMPNQGTVRGPARKTVRSTKVQSKRKRSEGSAGSGLSDRPVNSAAVIFKNLCQQSFLPIPVQEHAFAKDAGRKWRIDWYFEGNGRKVALEVEGGVWTGGRHTTGKGFSADMEKYNAMACRGILLLRTTPDQLLTMQTIKLLKAVIYGQHE